MIRIVAIAAVCCLVGSPIPAAETPAGSGEAAAEDGQGASHLLVVRVSSEVFRPRDPERTRIEQTSPVHEVILGTRAVGTAYVNGRISVDFFPDRDDTGLWLNFSGTCVARTVARQGPAIIHTVVTSEFACRKPLLFDLEQGFRYGDAESFVRIVSNRRCVESSVNGLRGRIVRRVAQRRLTALDQYLTCVAQRNTERRIENSFDRQANQRLATLNALFHDLRLALTDQTKSRSEEKYDVSLNTTNRYLQIGVGPPNAPNPRLPDADVPDMPIQVWLHASMFGQEAVPLLQQWDHLRLLLPTPSNVSGLMSAVRVPGAEDTLPLEFSVQLPWVVISAGRDRLHDKTSDLHNQTHPR